MSLKATLNALVSVLQADATLSANIGAANIKKGVETTFDLSVSTKGIRVHTFSDGGALQNIGGTKIDAYYSYVIMGFFYEEDVSIAEDIKLDYNTWIRNAVEADLSLGLPSIYETSVGVGHFDIHPVKKGLNFVMFPVVCKEKVSPGAR